MVVGREVAPRLRAARAVVTATPVAPQRRQVLVWVKVLEEEAEEERPWAAATMRMIWTTRPPVKLAHVED
jgi:hypothetical protein